MMPSDVGPIPTKCGPPPGNGAKREGYKLKSMTLAEANVIIARFAHYDRDGGFYYETDLKCWLPIDDLWEPAKPATPDEPNHAAAR